MDVTVIEVLFLFCERNGRLRRGAVWERAGQLGKESR